MICLSPDGSRLAVSSESERGVDIWDYKTGTRLYTLPDEPGTIYWLAWSPDSRRVSGATSPFTNSFSEPYRFFLLRSP